MQVITHAKPYQTHKDSAPYTNSATYYNCDSKHLGGAFIKHNAPVMTSFIIITHEYIHMYQNKLQGRHTRYDG